MAQQLPYDRNMTGRGSKHQWSGAVHCGLIHIDAESQECPHGTFVTCAARNDERHESSESLFGQLASTKQCLDLAYLAMFDGRQQ